ncbi:hypothetical protein [Fluviispira multicolorata]|uniref:Uncharacterized protein n=1 Tax=Fluviispira multicolorata TaxID=2654512 RepID=A0A833JEK6_9BACT|nr:hypothetical protein [Fluviispira multicolorata]KAB8029990.1 hypothetical protein GCL57_10665 [Fluviispira multicolorata]
MSTKKFENEEAYNKFEAIKIKKAILGIELDTARNKYEDLLRSEPNSPKTAEAKKLLDTLVEDYRTLLDFEYYPAEKEFNRTYREVKLASEQYDYIFNRFEELLKPLQSLQTTADNIAAAAQNSYQRYAVLEGLSANLLFNADTTNLVQKYQEMNKNLNIAWQPMLIKNAFFNAFLKESDTTPDTTFSVLIDASIPGVSYQMLKNIDPKTPLPLLNEKESKQDEFFGSASGRVKLNLLGGCTYYDNINQPVKENDINNISANMTLNVNYTYQVKGRRSFSAKYHLSNLYSKIESKTSSRGWFSTSSAHSIVENNETSDWFEIKFDGDNGEFQYTPREQSDITLEQKKLLFDRVLILSAKQNAGSTPPSIIQPPISGILYAAGRLDRCNYYYCQVGSFFIGTIGSIFGGSNASSYFRSQANFWAEDRVSGYQILDRSNKVTFTSKL